VTFTAGGSQGGRPARAGVPHGPWTLNLTPGAARGDHDWGWWRVIRRCATSPWTKWPLRSQAICSNAVWFS